MIAALLFSAALVTRARYLMGTVCEITAGDQTRIEHAFAEAARIEAFLSTWKKDSELSKLNAAGSMRVSAEMYSLLHEALRWSDRTGGAFNPLAGPIVELWQTRDEGSLPDDTARDVARQKAERVNVSLDEGVVSLTNGARFEEGAFGKGYAIDRMLNVIGGPSTTINFGGQIGVRGSATVSIADPAARDRAVLSFTLADGSLSTTSGSEKTFTVGGRRFSHIFDPRTGEALPPRGSVSVMSKDALTADVLSTALYVMGDAAGVEWADKHRVAAVFISPDRQIKTSQAFRASVHDLVVLDDHFTVKDPIN